MQTLSAKQIFVELKSTIYLRYRRIHLQPYHKFFRVDTKTYPKTIEINLLNLDIHNENKAALPLG